jgi:predicted Zn-dependent protease
MRVMMNQADRNTDGASRQARSAVRRWALVVTVLLVSLAAVSATVPSAWAALISQQQEIQIGRQAAKEIEAEVGLSSSATMAARVVTLGRRLVAVSDRPDVPYTFKVLRSKEVNAVSLPGGPIYATEGLLRFVQSDSELAFVLAHEVGHIAGKHHVAMIEREIALGVISRILLGGSSVEQLAGIARGLVARGYSRENEFDADRRGVRYTHAAKFDASQGLRFLERLRAAEGRDPGQVEVLLRTHPGLGDRANRVREQLRGLGYRVGARSCCAVASQRAVARRRPA